MKHAYLIMAHDDEWLLKKILKLLDSSLNDIYLHLDRKFDVNVNEINCWPINRFWRKL